MLCNLCLKEIEKNKEVKIEEHFYPGRDEFHYSNKYGYGYSGYLCKICYEKFLNLNIDIGIIWGWGLFWVDSIKHAQNKVEMEEFVIKTLEEVGSIDLPSKEGGFRERFIKKLKTRGLEVFEENGKLKLKKS